MTNVADNGTSNGCIVGLGNASQSSKREYADAGVETVDVS
jgi:hypothetical protein